MSRGDLRVKRDALLLAVHPMQLVDVLAFDDVGPAVLVNVVHAHDASGRAIAMPESENIILVFRKNVFELHKSRCFR